MQKQPTYEELLSLNERYKNDILQLKEEVNLLKKSFYPKENYYKDRFYKITENVDDVIYRINLPNVRYEYISQQVSELFGYSAEHFYNSPAFTKKIIHPDSLPHFFKYWRNLIKTDSSGSCELKIIKANQEVRWVQLKNLVIRDKKHVAIAVEGVVTDITQRKQTEKALIESEAQKKALLNNLPHMAWLKSKEGVYLSVNNSFAKSVGKEVSEVIGKTDHELYPKKFAKSCLEQDKKIIETKSPIHVEEINDNKWHETFKSPIFDENNKVVGITGISLEISERKKAESEIKKYSEKVTVQNIKLKLINDELKNAKEKAEESDKLKSAFLANMSHEIRTPMNAIIGFTSLIKSRDISKEKQDQYINLTHNNCNKLLKIISDIIDISKIESDQLVVYKRFFIINHELKEIHNSYKHKVKLTGKNLKLKLNLPLADERSIIYTDKVRLKQIISNIVSNAIKFSEKGTIEIGYELDHKNHIIFYVKDEGIGIDKEKQDVVFDRFRQVSSSPSRLYEGTGLGLSISKGLTRILKGNLWVESEKNSGSCFYLSIPHNPKMFTRHVEESNYAHNFNWKNKLILIADNNDLNYAILENAFSKAHARIVRARNNTELLNWFKKDKFIDLALVEQKLPGFEEQSSITKIRNYNSKSPIIALGDYNISLKSKIKQDNLFDGFVKKPIIMKALIDKINNRLNNKFDKKLTRPKRESYFN